MAGRTPRIAVCFDSFGPYHVARLAEIARRASVLAVEVSPTSSEYAWDRPSLPYEVDHVVLAKEPQEKRSARYLRGAIVRALGSRAIDAVVVPGWSSLASISLIQWARGRVPIIVMSDSNQWDMPRHPASEAVKRGIVAHFSAGLAAGPSQREYLMELGLPSASISLGLDVIDNRYFAEAADAARIAGKMPPVEGGLLPEAAAGQYFLVVSRFIEKKNHARLLRAYARFRADRMDDVADWPLVLVGDGPLRPSIEALRRELALDPHVHIAGFRQYHEMPAYYGTAGALVLASTTEQWGLVVNEAMASGLPVAISHRCGCTESLVRERENGIAFAAHDEMAIARALADIATAPNRFAMGEASRAIVADWGLDRFAQGLLDAVRHACVVPLPRPGPLDRLCLGLAAHRLARQGTA